MFSHSIVSPDIAPDPAQTDRRKPSLETSVMPGAVGMPAAFPCIEALHNVGENAMDDDAAARPRHRQIRHTARRAAKRPLAARRAVGRIVKGVTPISGDRWNIIRRS
jgi:hypothetical protein